MIAKMSHVSIYVIDQDSAYDFYINKLGFTVHTDAKMGEAGRWLTLTVPENREQEIVLMPIQAGMSFTEDSAAQMRALVRNGSFGFGVFETYDIYATYEELSKKGVEFIKPPTKEFYATEAIFKDDSGNWFSLTERKKQ